MRVCRLKREARMEPRGHQHTNGWTEEEWPSKKYGTQIRLQRNSELSEPAVDSAIFQSKLYRLVEAGDWKEWL